MYENQYSLVGQYANGGKVPYHWDFLAIGGYQKT
jgi:hypothetical protein